ncbi:unnamed protein product [Toxocara canis]|uniref:DUF5641 domain-containing protein n=1 Tax=Toxocara canis TaxID=6265 RepID=A0A183U9U6_TOXCA|nr:unnamed protein product [Toxocara canis]
MPEALSTREALLEPWKQTRSSLSRFWQLWSSAYLHFLRETTQREHVGPRSLTRRPLKKAKSSSSATTIISVLSGSSQSSKKPV